MTEHEENALCGLTVKQHQNARKLLACLATKAATLRAAVVPTLDAIQQTRALLDPLPAWPERAELEQLIVEYRTAHQTLTESETRLKAMGLSGYR